LLVQLQSVLDDGQLDDLRAALGRRPLVKQNGHVVINGQVALPGPQDVRLLNLVLRE
jgi:hypothetical protein